MAFGCIRSGSLTSACASQEHKISLANAQHEGAERELAEIEEEIESNHRPVAGGDGAH